MGHLAYLGVLALVLAGSLWLEVALRTRVLRRWRRVALSVLPVAALFVAWDWAAVAAGHWWFDPARVTGVVLPGGVPLEELMFFLVVPLAAILTLEAVRSATGLPVGDEPGDLAGLGAGLGSFPGEVDGEPEKAGDPAP